MNIQQIKSIVDNCLIPDTCKDIKYHEKENYWVIEGDNFTYKIYKPLKKKHFDHSTIEKRCEAINKELLLNKRLAKPIYTKIIAVKEIKHDQNIEENDDGNIIDYALVIKKVNNENSLKNIINSDKLEYEILKKIAAKIAQFHSNVRVVKNVFGITAFQQELEQILGYKDKIIMNYGKKNYDLIKMILDQSNKYLNRHRNFINDRTILGYMKDGHGAILPENIYLLDNEVFITNCISTNDSHRHIDILNEIAALGMELDSRGLHEFSSFFFEKYIQHSYTKNNFNTQELYEYYKKYHALKRITKHLQTNSDATKYLKILQKYEPELVSN